MEHIEESIRKHKSYEEEGYCIDIMFHPKRDPYFRVRDVLFNSRPLGVRLYALTSKTIMDELTHCLSYQSNLEAGIKSRTTAMLRAKEYAGRDHNVNDYWLGIRKSGTRHYESLIGNLDGLVVIIS